MIKIVIDYVSQKVCQKTTIQSKQTAQTALPNLNIEIFLQNDSGNDPKISNCFISILKCKSQFMVSIKNSSEIWRNTTCFLQAIASPPTPGQPRICHQPAPRRQAAIRASKEFTRSPASAILSKCFATKTTKVEVGSWSRIATKGRFTFNRGWRDYERGFGNIAGEFWLGLRKIHELTYSNRYELRVLLEDWDGTRAVARYSDFLVAGPEDKYQLRSLGSFSGDAGDSMSYNLNMSFSTFDEDNDAVPSYCAVSLKGAWWYRDCSLR